MKKFFLLFIIGFLFFSCQKEETTETQNPLVGINKTAPLASLISRVAQNATHHDDVIDNSNCYSVRLPVTLTVDGYQVNINSEDDYEDVEQIKHQYNFDDDIVHFAFPITIVFADFQQQIVTSQQQLSGISCGDDDFNEIRCIDFNYPITINTYNTATQAANVIAIESNTQLYDFIHNAASTSLFTIAYPISVTLSNGNSYTINSNNALENAIEDSIDDCDDDSGPVQPQELSDIITSGTWRISYCNEASDYTGYSFTFLVGGSVKVVKAGITTYGNWYLEDEDEHLGMTMNFESTALNGLENEEWKVTEFNETNFRLKNDHHEGSSGSGGNKYVYFTKN